MAKLREKKTKQTEVNIQSKETIVGKPCVYVTFCLWTLSA